MGRRSFGRVAVSVLLAVVTLSAGAVGAPALAPSYRDEVLADAPAGYWRFGETSGTVAADETANNNKGTYLQAVTKGVPGALATDTNTAARFDGGSGRVSMGDPGSGTFDFGTDDFTIEAWIKTAVNDERGIAGKHGTQYWQITVTDDGSQIGRLRAKIFDGISTRQVYSLIRVDNNAWHHIAVLFDRDSGVRFYTDGASAGFSPGTIPGDLSSTTEMLVGKVSGYPNFKGDIDEFAVYRGLLPFERIQLHYYAGLADPLPPVVTLSAPAGGSSSTDPTPAFAGTAGTAVGDSATVDIKLYGGTDTSGSLVQTVSGSRGSDGAYSLEATEALAVGTYTAQAVQADRAGNVGASGANTFTILDGTPPPPPPPPPPPDPVLIGAGDIASCGISSRDEATADILEDHPDATVFTLGDNAYDNGSAEDYANCYDPSWGRVKARTRPAVGGHDYLTPGASAYFYYFGAAAGDPAKGYYSYDLGSWHVVVLNAECAEIPSDGCSPGTPQEQWLRADLSAHPASCTVAYFHEPRFSSGAVHGSHTTMAPFYEALYDYGAEIVLGGDDHLYERFLPQNPNSALDLEYGITQFVVGTGGYGLLYDFAEPLPNSAARIPYTHGVLKLVLHENSYDWEFIPIAGQTGTDSGSADCHPPAGTPPPLPPPPPPPPPPPSLTYASEVLNIPPRAYRRLGEASGTIVADELGGAPGTYQNGVLLGVPGALAGDSNTAVRLDGGNDRITIGDPADGSLDFGEEDFTFEAWVKPSANDERAIITKRSASGGYWQVTVTDDSNHAGQLRTNISDTVVSRQAYSTRRVDDGVWHHVVVQFDRDFGIRFYIDGTPAGSFAAPVAGSVSNDGALILGKGPNYPEYKGELDEVALYAGVLPEATIAQHYAIGLGSG